MQNKKLRSMTSMSKACQPIKRLKTGCFSCRSRKKKCDELKPMCSGCKRNYLQCEWPVYKNQTLRDYENKAKSKKQSQSNESSFIIIDCTSIEDRLRPERFTQLNSLNFLNSSDYYYLSVFFGPLLAILVPPETREIAREHLQNLVMKNIPLVKVGIFLGCSYLYYQDSSKSQIVALKYSDVLRELHRAIQGIQEEITDDWLINSVALLTFREQFLGLGTREIVKHLRTLYYLLIKKSDRCMTSTNFGIKVIIDSFLFHYAINMISFNDSELKTLPNPFLVEKQFLVLSDEYDYAINPILGSSFRPFLVVAQVSYLVRIEQEDHTEILSNALYSYIINELDINRRSNRKTVNDVGPIFTRILLNASLILLKKVMDRQLHQKDSEIQNIVDSIMEDLRICEDLSTFDILGLWSLFICGLCCENSLHRTLIKKFLHEIHDERFSSRNKLNVSKLLTYIWSENLGLETIFHVELLRSTSLG